MAEDKKVITIDDIDYTEDQLSDHAKACINHIGSLDSKISTAERNLIQLKVGRQGFVNMLKSDLEATDEVG